MGPTRKKSKTKHQDESPKPGLSQSTSSTTSKLQNTTNDGSNDHVKPPEPSPLHVGESKSEAGPSAPSTPAQHTAAVDIQRKIKAKSSWYGTWPRKSMASTSVARETILADKPPSNAASADLSKFEPRKSPATLASRPVSRPPSMYLGKSKETLDISMAGTLNDTPEEEREEPAKVDPKPTSDEAPVPESPKTADQPAPATLTQPALPPPALSTEGVADRPATASGWLGGWLSRAPIQPSESQQKVQEQTEESEQPKNLAEEQPAEDPPVAKDTEAPEVASEEGMKSSIPTTTASSWFGLWSTAPASTVSEAPREQMPVSVAKKDDEDTIMEDAPLLAKEVPKPAPRKTPAAGSSWAFWSSDSSKKSADVSDETAESGELAVTGESSQDSPEPAKTATIKDDKKGKTTKRGRPVSVEIDENSPSSKASAASTVTSTSTASQANKVSPPNLLMPSVKSTYKLAESLGILQQIARVLLRHDQQPAKHVFLVKEPPKIKKALAIGIHGLFPAAILRTVIGQPTGTSIRFANHASAAIRRWADNNGSTDCEIEKVALEGEGKIAERVDNLWKLLLNWIDHVRKADFILIACHSQGVPVAIMLIAKLIEFGVVTHGRIGVCAMAGVSLGPFADYKSKFFSGSAGELFEFADPESLVSTRYEHSLRVALHYGVRVMYCGSIDDQLVSMESAIFSPASHPYIYRTVFIDGRIHAPDFLSHLVGFALKLRNLGVPDHGLIRELSAPLAGSLYTGEGHSRLYDEGKVYE